MARRNSHTMPSIPKANRLYFLYSSAERSGSGVLAGLSPFRFDSRDIEVVKLCRDTRTAGFTSRCDGEARDFASTG